VERRADPDAQHSSIAVTIPSSSIGSLPTPPLMAPASEPPMSRRWLFLAASYYRIDLEPRAGDRSPGEPKKLWVLESQRFAVSPDRPPGSVSPGRAERRSATPTTFAPHSLAGNLVGEMSVVCPRVSKRPTPTALRCPPRRRPQAARQPSTAAAVDILGPAVRSRSDRLHDANGQKYKAAEMSRPPLRGIRAPARCLSPETLGSITRGTPAGDLGSDSRRRSWSISPARLCRVRRYGRRRTETRMTVPLLARD
jgi:hypothetical protein